MKSRYKIGEGNYAYFITSTIVGWLPVFRNRFFCNIIIDALKYCRKNKGLKIYAYVILDNHIHLIVSGEKLSRIIKDLKSFTARQIIDLLKEDKKYKWLLWLLKIYKRKYKDTSDHQLWQEGFHPKQIISDEVFRQKVEYIHNNPVKRGLVRKVEDWIYSSASVFNGDEGVLEIDSYFD